MKLISELKFGIWNAWILMIWQVLLPVFISALLNKNRISSRLFASAPAKHGKLMDIASMVLLVVSVIYSIFLPIRYATIWFFPGLSIFILALVISFTAIFALKHAKIDKPFTNGMYRCSRHPFYLSMGLMYIGATMISGSWVFLIFTMLFIIQIIIAAPIEERDCLKIYGKEYQEYMDSTPRWVGLPRPGTH